MDTDIQTFEGGQALEINQSMVNMQVATAHRFPRNLKKFKVDAMSMIETSEEMAASCFYDLSRKSKDGSKKNIPGPSVRLAEIVMSCWGNLQIGGRILSTDDKYVTVEGGAWDMEKNIVFQRELRLKIVGSSGRRFSDDMIDVTTNRAIMTSIRNAIFAVIPKSYVKQLEAHARSVATGGIGEKFTTKRQNVVDKLMKVYNVSLEQILARVACKSVDEIQQEELAILIGSGTAIKEKLSTIDEEFPEIKDQEEEKEPESKTKADGKIPPDEKISGAKPKSEPAKTTPPEKPKPEPAKKKKETPPEPEPEPTPDPAPTPEPDPPSEDEVTEEMSKKLYDLAKSAGLEDKDLREKAYRFFETKTITKLKLNEYEELTKYLEEMAKRSEEPDDGAEPPADLFHEE